MADTAKALERERQNDKPPKPLPAYVGIYWNAQRCLKIVVALCNDKLSWALQGLEAEEYELEHYEGDTFVWVRDRNYLTARGRWVDQPPIYCKIRFYADTEGHVRLLNWDTSQMCPSGKISTVTESLRPYSYDLLES